MLEILKPKEALSVTVGYKVVVHFMLLLLSIL